LEDAGIAHAKEGVMPAPLSSKAAGTAQMKIYTKTGDGGETSLFGGARVSKDDTRIEAYGCVDELNSCLGIVRSLRPSQDLDGILLELQNDLFVLGADLATPAGSVTAPVPRIAQADAERLEHHIDRLEERLEPLKSFVLPGGCALAAQVHQARTVCRRAERLVVRLSKVEAIGPAPLMFLNRLSDLLFVMARFANLQAETPETPWRGLRAPKG
jgi:cob(I)alamin adenosyltransferase